MFASLVLSAGEVPQGYVQLSYLESGGDVWFNSGYSPTNGHRLDYYLAPMKKGWYSFLGCTDGSAGLGISMHGGVGTFKVGYTKLDTSPLTYVTVDRSYHFVILMPGYDSSSAGLYRIDDKDNKSGSGTLAATTKDMAIFGFRESNGSVTTGPMKFYSLTIRDANGVLHEYLPVRRTSDDALGLYDTCATGDGFIEKSGTGTLTGGEEYIPSYIKIGTKAYDTLEAAYAAANDHEVISVRSGSDPIRLSSDLLVISKPITIRGAGASPAEAVIKPKSSAADAFLFTLDNPDARLENLTLAEGMNKWVNNIDNWGTSPFVVNSGTVSNCVVRDFVNGGGHGAMTMYGGTLVDSVVENNTVSTSNGNLGHGGGLLLLGGSPLVTNCIIRGNKAYCKGGGLFCAAKDALVTGCVISNNSHSSLYASCAGVYICAGTLDHCKIVANTTAYPIGGLQMAAGNSWGGIAHGEKGDVLVKWCLIADNTSAGASSGVDISHGTLFQCTVANNACTDKKPGGLTQSGGVVANCLFALNSGIASTASEQAFARTAGTLTNCVSDVAIPETVGTCADNQVGAVNFKAPNEGDYHLSPGCVATHAGCYEYDVSALTCAPLYDGLRHDGKTPIKFTCTVDGAKTGEILYYAWDFQNDGTVDSTLESPEWKDAPYGIYHTKLTVTSSSGATDTAYVANDVKVLPPVVYVAEGKSGTWPYDTPDTATDDLELALDAVCATEAAPGEIIVAEGTYDVNSFWAQVDIPVKIKGAGAEKSILKAYNGGKKYRRVMLLNHSQARVSGLTMMNGQLRTDQGGIGSYTSDGAGPAALRIISGTVSGCVIRDNEGSGDSGGVEMRGGTLEDCRVLRNLALIAGNSTRSVGGGIAITDSGAKVVGCEVIGNRTNIGGAGIWIGAGLTDVVVSNCVVACSTNNLVAGYKASGRNGVAIHASSGLFTGCTITENYNSAYLAGDKPITGEGTVYLAGKAELRNSLVARNVSRWGAQSVYQNGSDTKVVNCTITDNGLTEYESAEVLANRLNAGTLANTIAVGDRGGVTNVIAAALTTVASITDGDPKLLGWGREPYRPRKDSPAVNGGNDAVWGGGLDSALDLRGKPRKCGRSIDIGCYEHSAVGLILSVR